MLIIIISLLTYPKFPEKTFHLCYSFHIQIAQYIINVYV